MMTSKKEIRILVTGAAGMVGDALCPIFRKEGYEVLATDIDVNNGEKIGFLDVKDVTSVFKTVREEKPDVVIHLAAETDVDKCEIEIDHAFRTNVIGTQNVTLACQRYDAVMAYVSTAGVFDGTKYEPYTEFDDPAPINVYGKTKLEGERFVQSMLSRYYIVRSGWMMGGGEKDKKFVAKIIKQLVKTSKLSAVIDKFGSPTYTVDLSHGLKEMIESDYYGLYHMANKGYASRYDVAKKIVEYLGRDDVIVEPTSSAYFPLPAPRGRSEMMRNYKLELLGKNTMRPWEEALQEYVELNFKSRKKV